MFVHAEIWMVETGFHLLCNSRNQSPRPRKGGLCPGFSPSGLLCQRDAESLRFPWNLKAKLPVGVRLEVLRALGRLWLGAWVRVGQDGQAAGDPSVLDSLCWA